MKSFCEERGHHVGARSAVNGAKTSIFCNDCGCRMVVDPFGVSEVAHMIAEVNGDDSPTLVRELRKLMVDLDDSIRSAREVWFLADQAIRRRMERE